MEFENPTKISFFTRLNERISKIIQKYEELFEDPIEDIASIGSQFCDERNKYLYDNLFNKSGSSEKIVIEHFDGNIEGMSRDSCYGSMCNHETKNDEKTNTYLNLNHETINTSSNEFDIKSCYINNDTKCSISGIPLIKQNNIDSCEESIKAKDVVIPSIAVTFCLFLFNPIRVILAE
ncbi:unnamed protein product [Gordionus sp. m RMFG-2023]